MRVTTGSRPSTGEREWGGVAAGCEKVDFLFVIDNSISMLSEQTALVASFPGFMAAIEATLTADDYHIMVVDTDAATRCTTEGCNKGRRAVHRPGRRLCLQHSVLPMQQAAGCRGSAPGGQGRLKHPCNPHGGNRYIVQDEPDLTGKFSCMAQVGLAAAQAERPMDAMVAALSPALNAGGCNDGFLRDDAVLVVTFISDDPWYEDSGTPQQWYDAVVAAKNGNPDAIVMLGLTPSFPGCLDGKGPPKGAHWSQFIDLWGASGLEGSVCDSDYVDIFSQAISAIDNTCDNFVPPPQ